MINQIAILSVFLPLCGFLLSCFLPNKRKNQIAPYITTTFLFFSFLLSVVLALSLQFGPVHEIKLFTWFKVENLKVNWGLFIDSLSLTMLLVVTCISSVVHLYSFGYMHHDKNIGKFFSLLSLFTFFMLILVTSPNLVQLFFGWEGVGLASYLLIGFWYDKEAPPKASMKAFIVNRVGDLGLVAALGLCFFIFESIELTDILSDLVQHAPKTIHLFSTLPAYEVIAFFMILGAMGKSAQFGLHTWLPDAMEGPTPVSALIHAATMVTAGVFLICRFSPLFDLAVTAKTFLLILGSITSIFAATIAITQTDIKRIIAYSTCSQLGYMIMACGASAYSAAMFHLVTHAFFKALLFLGAGSVIHAMSGEQDINKMGGLYKMVPFTYSVMMIGSLSISGIPFLAGYYSKDAILHAVYNQHSLISMSVFVVGLIVVFLTAFYSFRLIVLVFHHSMRNDEHVFAHVHESPVTMKIPLIILSIGAIFSGIVGQLWYIEEVFGFKWGSAISVEISAPQGHSFITAYLPFLIAVLGIFSAYILYFKGQQIVKKITDTFSVLYQFLFNKWYVDEFYEKIIIRPAQRLGYFLWKTGESSIDDVGPDGLTQGISHLSGFAQKLATGHIQHMIIAMGIILSVILGVYIFFQYYFYIG